MRSSNFCGPSRGRSSRPWRRRISLQLLGPARRLRGGSRATTSATSRAATPWHPRWRSSTGCRRNSTTANTRSAAPASKRATATISWRWRRSCERRFRRWARVKAEGADLGALRHRGGSALADRWSQRLARCGDDRRGQRPALRGDGRTLRELDLHEDLNGLFSRQAAVRRCSCLAKVPPARQRARPAGRCPAASPAGTKPTALPSASIVSSVVSG